MIRRLRRLAATIFRSARSRARSSARLLTCVLVSVGITTSSMQAGADKAAPPTPKTSAARHFFEAGLLLFERGEFLEAATEFERAYAEEARPAFLYNVASAYDYALVVGGAMVVNDFDDRTRYCPEARARDRKTRSRRAHETDFRHASLDAHDDGRGSARDGMRGLWWGRRRCRLASR